MEGRASLGLGLVIVKVRVVVCPERIGLGLKIFSIVGGRTATRLAFAEPVEVEFVPLSADEIKPLTFGCGPEVVAVTAGVVIVQLVPLAPPANMPPVKVIVPVAAMVVSVPPHMEVGPLLEMLRPAGKISVN